MWLCMVSEPKQETWRVHACECVTCDTCVSHMHVSVSHDARRRRYQELGGRAGGEVPGRLGTLTGGLLLNHRGPYKHS